MTPKVSVAMISYNQEKYIGEAIESALGQQVNFPFEIVIGEDCSTDDTLSICQSYQKKNPDQIRLLERQKNLGMAQNFLSTLKECRGDYIAVLEGDDLWIDPLKLQKQSDFLDAEAEYALVFGKTLTFYQDDSRPGFEIPPNEAAPFNIENLLRNNFIAACSVMYRRGLVKEYPSWLTQLDMMDWPMHILHAQYGKIGYIDKPIAKYRIHSESYYSSRKAILNFKGILRFYRVINFHLGFKYAQLIYHLQSWVCRKIAIQCQLEKQRLDVLYYISYAVYYRTLSYLPNSFLAHLKVK